MTSVETFLGAFHFLRPAWLVALPVVFGIWWLVRRRGTVQPAGARQIAPHLLDHLLINRQRATRVRPVDLVLVALFCAALAAAGPTWRRVPNPFFSEAAPLVIALKVSETMLANDVQPTRLERAKLKILDLIPLRAGARTALIAYAGSAHVVLPATEDPEILKPFLNGLAPDVMPVRGANAADALSLAVDVLAREETPGTILFVNDGVDALDFEAFSGYAGSEGAAGIVALVLGTEEGGSARRPDGSFVTGPGGRRLATGVDLDTLGRWARAGNVDVIRGRADDGDVRRVEARVRSNLRDAFETDDRAKWDDRGWLLVWPALFVTLFWFRRGWTMRWVWLLAVALPVAMPGPARAQGGVDWFLTPDQQGRLAFEDKRFSEAGDRFADPMWKGTALYRAGRYLEAAEAFARVPSADGLFNMGNAFVKGREYAKAVQAYEQALTEDPAHADAQQNLEIARAIIAHLTRVRQQEDTGEQTELGADDYKFDNTSGEGKEIIITGQGKLKLESAEQWMRMVDTRPADFLRTKFALEAAERSNK